MMTSSCLKLNNILYLLVKDSCITVSLLYKTVISISCSFTKFLCWYVAQHTFIYVPCLLIDRHPRIDVTSLTTSVLASYLSRRHLTSTLSCLSNVISFWSSILTTVFNAPHAFAHAHYSVDHMV